jgi:hypothetical protein
MQFRLEVQGIESVCNFRLSWGGSGEQLVATVPYPATVVLAYEHWREQYLMFYNHLALAPPASSTPKPQPLRGKADLSGVLEPITVDWGLRLKHAQETLRSEFQEWLCRGELLPIRRKLSQANGQAGQGHGASGNPVEPQVILLSCYSIDLERLPWEDWEIASEFNSSQQLRLIRSPLNIASPPPAAHRPRLRMLAIMGDETGQDFTEEKKALMQLAPKVKVEFLELRDDPTIDLSQQICRTLEDPVGWDMLFFAGHSSESAVAGGMIQCTPQRGMLMTELLPSLQIAKQRGLHLAIFNSCSGLNIAQSLVGIGLAQVVIMREKIHGQVASKFLVEFTQKLQQGQNSHTAFLSACDYLKRLNQTYPSAFLVPSLFAHPHATSLALRSWRWRSWLAQLLPTRREAIALGSCIALSVMPPVREALLDQRTWVQAHYRHLTGQIPPASKAPILLVQIDKDTLNQIPNLELIYNNSPIMDRRRILAPLVRSLSESGARLIGFDYIFDQPVPPQDRYLSEAINHGISRYGGWFIFAEAFSHEEGFLSPTNKEGFLSPTNKEGFLSPTNNIANPRNFLYGCANSDSIWHINLPALGECGQTLDSDDPPKLPLPYVLAFSAALRENKISLNAGQEATAQESLIEEIAKAQEQSRANSKIHALSQVYTSDITFLSKYMNQNWLQPLLDYSIPPDRVFQKISAIELINKTKSFKIAPDQIVIIASGGYTGLKSSSDLDDADTYPLPRAISFWRSKQLAVGNLPKLTGGEAIAYATYHLYHQKFLAHIPDLWIVLMVGLVARNIKATHSLRSKKSFWIGTMAAYVSISLQLYVTAGILIPFTLPLLAWFWSGTPYARRKVNGSR